MDPRPGTPERARGSPHAAKGRGAAARGGEGAKGGGAGKRTKAKAYSTRYSQAVSHPSTNQARPCLASEIRRDRARSGWYGRRRRRPRPGALRGRAAPAWQAPGSPAPAAPWSADGPLRETQSRGASHPALSGPGPPPQTGGGHLVGARGAPRGAGGRALPHWGSLAPAGGRGPGRGRGRRSARAGRAAPRASWWCGLPGLRGCGELLRELGRGRHWPGLLGTAVPQQVRGWPGRRGRRGLRGRCGGGRGGESCPPWVCQSPRLVAGAHSVLCPGLLHCGASLGL